MTRVGSALCLIAVSPGCVLRFFPSALADCVTELRNLIGEFGSRVFTAGWCDEQTDSYPDTNSNQKSNALAQELRILLTTKRVTGSAHPVGRSAIRVSNSGFDVV